MSLVMRASFDKLTELAQSAADYKGRVDVNAECFLAPKSMCAAVKNELMKQGFKEPTVPEMLSCVYHSLAESYAETIKALEKLTGKIYEFKYCRRRQSGRIFE